MAVEENEVMTDRALSESMDEDIRATLNDIKARNPDALKEETPEPEPKPEPVRDPEGKFAKEKKNKGFKSKESAAPATPDTPETPIEATGPEQAAADTPQEPPEAEATAPVMDITRPPSSWKPAAKTAWSALPEPVRAEIYRRETDFLHGQKSMRETADFGREVKQTIEPYRMLIEAEGGTPTKAIGDLLKTAALFRVGAPQQKLQALFQLDQQFNAGLSQFIQSEIARHSGQAGLTEPQPQTGGQPQVPFTDPRVDQILQSLQAQERQRSQEQERVSSSAVDAFIAEKDADGEPAHPFVDNVLEDMSARIAAIRGQNPAMEHASALKRAYDEAVWANPETRAVLLAAQQAQVNQPAETQRRVEAARRASGVNVPKRGAIPATGPKQSLDETIRETGRALGMF